MDESEPIGETKLVSPKYLADLPNRLAGGLVGIVIGGFGMSASGGNYRESGELMDLVFFLLAITGAIVSAYLFGRHLGMGLRDLIKWSALAYAGQKGVTKEKTDEG